MFLMKQIKIEQLSNAMFTSNCKINNERFYQFINRVNI